MTTMVDWTFIDERDLDELPPSRSYIVVTRSPRHEQTRPALPISYLRVPFGPKALAKALQMAVHSRRISSVSTITDNLRRFQMSQPEAQTTPPSEGFKLSAPSPITRHLSSSAIGIPSPTSPLALPAHKRPTEYFTGLQHAHSDAIVPTTSSPAPRGASVLCVDDNTINLRLLQTYCTKLGFNRVVTAEDGLQAVQADNDAAFPGDPPGGAHPFDVIFMDLTMPVCDGFEATKRIREFEAERRQLALTDTEDGSAPQDDGESVRIAPSPRATVIAITALASEADQKKAFTAGVDHFVTKPLRFKDLKVLLVDLGVL